MTPTIRAQLAPYIRAHGVGKAARAVGLAQPNLTAWLNGRGRLADEHVEAICRHLGLTLAIAPATPATLTPSSPAGPPAAGQ